MKLYQLFKAVPPVTLLLDLLLCYGLRGLEDASEFSKVMLRERNTIEKLYELLPELIIYYIPCKARKYLGDLNEDRAITILRQLLRLYNYELGKKERVVRKKKIIYYYLQSLNSTFMHIQQVHDTITLT
jgi:hypothetical protein